MFSHTTLFYLFSFTFHLILDDTRLFCLPIPLLKLQDSDVVASEGGQVWCCIGLTVQCVGFSVVTDFKLAEYQSPHSKLSIELVLSLFILGFCRHQLMRQAHFVEEDSLSLCRHKNKLFSVDENANFSFCAMKHN